jgi:DNA-binding Lrp family transcriptional regulator
VSQHRLDVVDDAILRVLQQDARASLSNIGSRVGLSPDAVRSRLERLTGDGTVRVVGVVDPSCFGLATVATVGVDYHGDLRAFVALVRRIAPVTFVAVTLGDRNVMAEVMAEDDGSLVDLVYGELAHVDGVRHVELWKHLRAVKQVASRPSRGRAGTSAGRAGCRLDELDVQLLRMLAANPRVKFSTLGATLDVPYSLARRRSQALFEAGVIEATALVDTGPGEPEIAALVGIETVGAEATGVEQLATQPQVGMLVRTSGRFQAVAEVTCRSDDELVTFVDTRVVTVPGVRRVDVYPYARVEAIPFPWAERQLPAGAVTAVGQPPR